MFSTGQTVVVGMGLVMAGALGFTTAKALQDQPGPAAGPSAPSATASASAPASRAAAGRTTAAAQPAGSGSNCRAEVVLQDRWPDGFKVEIRVTNRGGQPVQDWTASFRMPAGAELASTWNADLEQDGTRVTVEAPDWQRDLAPAQTATFGFTASGKPKPLPGDLHLSGAACS